MNLKTNNPGNESTVYGPIRSWRLGWSLGIDLLYVNSICSFRCVYCQLGHINVHTMERRVYVPTERVLADLETSDWRTADVITVSGNGEPTLAANLGEVICASRALTRKPVIVLTNATTLSDPQVRHELSQADRVFVKLDAADERMFTIINRPVSGVTLRQVIAGIHKFRSEYTGCLAIQTMLMPMNRQQLQTLATVLREIGPDEVQLNTPLRPVPHTWSVETRGNHDTPPADAVRLRVIERHEAEQMSAALHQMTGLPIVSVYQPVSQD